MINLEPREHYLSRNRNRIDAFPPTSILGRGNDTSEHKA